MIRRAWNTFVAEGRDKDTFANRLASRVHEEIDPCGGHVELVENWLEIADAKFDTGIDAEDVNLSELYDLVQD